MALPLLAGIGLVGGYGYLRNRYRNNMLDKIMGTPGQEMEGPLQAGQERPMYGGSGLLGNPYSQDAQSQAAAKMGLLGLSGGQIQQVLNPYQTGQDPTTLQRQFEYYQSLPDPMQQELLDYRRAGAQNINLNQGMQGRLLTPEEISQNNLPPEGTYQYDKSGMIKPVSKEKYTQAQILAGGFASQMATANEDIQSILSDKDFEPGGIIQNIEDFGVPELFANFLRSAEGQRYKQAQDSWIIAKLRKQSGATITSEEMENERRTFFPVVGDKPENIAQKRKARKDAERAMKEASGGSFSDIEDDADMEELEELRKLQGDL